MPHAQANLAKIPNELRDEQVVLLADIASTGFSAAESANLQLGDSVAVFAQGPIGLCATLGARLKGAGFIVAVESDPRRSDMARQMGADVVLDPRGADVSAEIKRLSGGGVDVAIEALGTQQTFENALKALRPAGTLSSLGVYSGKLGVPVDAFLAGIGDYKIATTLCPGGKERMRRLMELVALHRIDLTSLLRPRTRPCFTVYLRAWAISCTWRAITALRLTNFKKIFQHLLWPSTPGHPTHQFARG